MPSIRYEDHTDSVEDKLRLVRNAYAAGKHDIALSLAASIRDTIAFERQSTIDPVAPDIDVNAWIPVGRLAPAWAEWAKGWSHCVPLVLFETVGIARSREPVDVRIAFPVTHTTDPAREVRVARLDPRAGSLHEIPSQIHGEVRNGPERRCRLVFCADVPMHGQAIYLVLCGNRYAERPDYTTDLRVSGTGFGLEIVNAHATARLSPQTGQLERLTFKREHGLELYAGGKGHGEPPNIDWGHDYVDENNFQKLRMRNWPACPNFEVVVGPLCVLVRRWGFPASPVHPLFTPSRIHMDITYAFYAHQPYFIKEGRTDIVKDVRIEAMRDDEWVFSGYSFTDTVWIDRAGRLHEGAVPAEHGDDLWGVGFFHRDSRDAFIALRLEHSAEGFADLHHDGAPTLHYDGHGQLWSRYPARNTMLEAGSSFRQKNAYWLAPYPAQGATTVERVYHQLRNPLTLQVGELPRVPRAVALGALARIGETAETAPLKPAIWDALRQVRDEQLYKADANVVDMGYVYDVRVRQGVVHVLVTMPHRGRPVYRYLVSRGGGRVGDGIRETLRKLPGVRDVVVDGTWNPPWTAARLTDAGRRAMGLPV